MRFKVSWLRSTKVRLWMIAITLALGMWFHHVYRELAYPFDAARPEIAAQINIARRSDCIYVSDYVVCGVSNDLAVGIAWDIDKWRDASYFFLFIAGLLSVWLIIDLIAPWMDRFKRGETDS